MKLIIPHPYCTYRIISDGPIKYGKLCKILSAATPLVIEIMGFYPTLAEAAKNAKSSRVLCHTTGVTYPSIKAAAEALRMHPSGIRNHLRGVPGFERPRGHTFQRV